MCSADIPEVQQEGEGAADFVQRLAHAKAAAVAEENPAAVVVGADTAVVHGGVILGKPAHVQEATAMVTALAGGWHEVWSGFAIVGADLSSQVSQAVCTKVRFAKLTKKLCQAYGASGDGLDKAGGYGIQSGGSFLVEEIVGSYSNVIGLPVAELVRQLLRLGVITPG